MSEALEKTHMLFLLILLSTAGAIIISAPEKCGGTKVVTHAIAFFGPTLTQTELRNVLIFAPDPQHDGSYVPTVRAPQSVCRRQSSGQSFGKSFPFLSCKVKVTPAHVPSNLFNACEQLSVPADLRMVQGRVAVVARGRCELSEKVSFMQAAGAVGVIVVNFNDRGALLANMKLGKRKNIPKIRIPTVMIAYKDWETIAPCQMNTKVVFSTEGEPKFEIDRGHIIWAVLRSKALRMFSQLDTIVLNGKQILQFLHDFRRECIAILRRRI